MTFFEEHYEERVFTEMFVTQQVERIFTDPQFAGSDILKRFLSFVVSETLAGRSHTIKEYTIGVKVLEKPVDFKPQHDAIVRIHAGRLRRALNHYYKESGSSDPLYISMPKGSYVPVFQHHGNKISTDETPDETIVEPVFHKPIGLAVLPFTHYKTDPSHISFADGLGELLSSELSRFQDISVIAYYTMRQMPGQMTDTKQLEPELGVQYIIAGNLQFQAGNLRTTLELIDVRTSEQIWSKVYEHKFSTKNIFVIQDEIVKHVIGVLGDYCGLIVRHTAKASLLKKTHDLEVHSAVLWYYYFYSEFTPEAFQKALRAMETAVKREPDYALAWAFLSELYLHAHMFNHSIKGNVTERALKCAQKAVQLDPHCQNAYVALAFAYAHLHDKKQCCEAIENCVVVNPNAVNIVGMAGFLLICIGEHERGFQLMKRSLNLNRFYPPWFNGGIALYHFIRKDYEQAYKWAEKIDLPHLGWNYLLCASALGHLNRISEARPKIKGLLEQIPDFPVKGREYISIFLLNEKLINILFDGLNLAGLSLLAVA